ncbi:MAG: endolytic transglycosylase MltG [Anaerolineae bacterium]
MNRRDNNEPRGLTSYRAREARETSPWRRLTALLLAVVVFAAFIGVGVTVWRGLRNGPTTTASSAPGAADASASGDLQSLAGRLFISLQSGDVDQPAGTDPTPVKFEIKSGEAAGTVADNLKQRGLIKDPTLFRLLLRVQGADTKLEAGTYELRQTMTPREIAAALQQGRTSTVNVTIPEGWRAEEIAALLASRGLVDQTEFMRLVRTGEGFNYPFLPPAGANGVRLEGYLFPDTYTFDVSKSGARVVIDRMLRNFGDRTGADIGATAAKSDLGSLQNVLALASIVEREAQIAEERPHIAGVYANRLKQGMKLDADPTVQYAMGFDTGRGTWWRPLTPDDYRFDSPWNTYVNPGLPPGPIANAGLDAIKAALNPMPTQDLYFVAQKDGSHVFAKTFEEHVRNVNAQK